MTADGGNHGLAGDVASELRSDSRVCDAGIEVQARDGVVMLSGFVDSWAGRRAAEEAAQRVSGVRYVGNAIRVQLPAACERSDAELARAVRFVIEWNVLIRHDLVRASVKDGVVHLHGTVGSLAERDAACDTVGMLVGVREVQSSLMIDCPTDEVAPLSREIQRALRRHDTPLPTCMELSVAEDGTVTLSGGARSIIERSAVADTIRRMRGVHALYNLVVVDR